MTELTDIIGVGPSYAEDLQDEGYESVLDVASADPEELDGVLPTLDGDELVSNAQKLVDEFEDDEEDEDEDEAEPVEFEANLITVDIDLDEDQRNHLVSALVSEEMRARKTNKRGDVKEVKDAIRQVLDGGELKVTMNQLNTMYRGVSQLESTYRSQRGVGSFVTKIRNLKTELQSIRQENWPGNE